MFWTGVAALLAAFLVAGFLRLNDLSLYTPDSIRYVIWGHAIAHGHGFTDDTQPDPQAFVEHAPLYAALIAPAELFGGRSLLAVKIATLLWGALAIVLTAAWFRRKLGDTAGLAATLVLVCNPLTLTFATEALSEAPFLAFLAAILLLLDRAVGERPMGRGEAAAFYALTASVGLLREVGVAVTIAVVLALLLRRRFARAGTSAALAALLLLAWYVRNQKLVPIPEGAIDPNAGLIFQHFVTGQDASMVAEFAKRIVIDLQGYAWLLGGMILYPLHGSGQVNLTLEAHEAWPIVRLLVVSFATALVAAGAVSDWRDRKAAIPLLVLVVAYLLVLGIYPVHDIRFVYPILPVILYYIARGALALPEYVPAAARLGRPVLVLGVTALLMVPNVVVNAELVGASVAYNRSPVGFYRELVARPAYPMIYTWPWSLVGEYLRDSVPAGSVIASPTKHIAIFAGESKVLELSADVTEPLFERSIRDNGVGYIVTKNRWEDFKYYEFLMKESARYRFDSVYHAANLFVYRVSSRLRTGAAGDGAGLPTAVADSASAAGLLRLGRAAFLRGDLAAARRLALLGAERAPGQPEPLGQAILAASMEGDEAGAEALYERLLQFPQSASLTFLARAHMDAMRVALSARGVAPSEQRTVTLSDLARSYWEMGYRRAAEKLADETLRDDSTYFWGLLWAFHYNEQNGDTADAGRYYRRLVKLAPGNQVVVCFERLIAIRNALAATADPAVQCALHVEAGRLYARIELYEEALDEAERALRADPRNPGALGLAGEVFLTKGRLLLDEPKAQRTNGPLRQSARAYDAMLAAAPADPLARAKADTLRSLLHR